MKIKKVGANMMSNIVAKLWSMVSIYLFIPLYINILGEAAYGLVSIFATLQATLSLLGLGLANTLGREFATGDDGEENRDRKYKLLRSVELIYLGIGIIISLLCIFGSDFIANDWLNIENLEPVLVSRVISLMGISIALQLIAHMYSGCLLGMEHQVLANVFCIVWSALKSIGSLLIIWLIEPNLTYFYGWNVFIDLIYVLTLRVWIRIKCPSKAKWKISDLSNLKQIWRYTLGILVISFISLINRQFDKLIISKYLSLTDVGAYNVANTLGSITAIIPSAIYTTMFPKFTNYATTGKTEILQREFIKINKLVNLVLMCMGAYISVYALQLIYVWTGSQVYQSALGMTGAIVVLAVMFSEIQEIPYALALSNGNTRLNVFVGLIFLPFVLIITLFSVKFYGLVGAGVVYLIMMLGQSILYQVLICKKYVPGKALKVLLLDTLLPFVISFVVAVLTSLIVAKITTNALLQSLSAVLFGIITLALLYLIFIKNRGKTNKEEGEKVNEQLF